MRLTALLTLISLLPMPALAQREGVPEHSHVMGGYVDYIQECLDDKVPAAGRRGVDIDDDQQVLLLGAQCQCEYEHLPPQGETFLDSRLSQAISACANALHDGEAGFYDTYVPHLQQAIRSH